MPFDRECLLFVIPLVVVALALFLFGLAKPAWAVVALAAFVLFFFRDPSRVIPADEDLIVAPADGKVIRIDSSYQNDDFPDGAVCVSIFLSIFNVHVQRSPIAGTVATKKYNKGLYLAAWNHKASEDNESNLTIFDTSIGKVGVKQIAGLVARRVVTRVNVGQTLAKGEHIGLIRFGSRVDLILPQDVELVSKMGDKVSGGSTVMARIKVKAD
ncbi:MAG: phosphatidylserine decarboxylase family protein [Nitrospinota bacterium]|nr:phosphatidylserine decarboxylase family protein [Nitrospinota bacterium]